MTWGVEPKIFVLLAGPHGYLPTLDLLEKEVSRLKEYRDSGRQLPLAAKVAAFSYDHQKLLHDIQQFQPAILHIRNVEYDREFLNSTAILDFCIAAVRGVPTIHCVVLENCFSLVVAEDLAKDVLFVIGINGRFSKFLLSSFYARLRLDGLYYEVFDAAQWQFFNNAKEAKEATAEELPHIITRDTAALEAGSAGLISASSVPGKAITRGLAKPYESLKQPKIHRLFYGTNRRPIDPDDLSKGYSDQREERLHLGICDVVVPQSHKIGSLGTSLWRQIIKRRPPDGPLRLEWQTLKRLTERRYWSEIRRRSRSYSGVQTNMLYIHGYNVDFELAALRAAQLKADLKLTGVMTFFSWPSKGKFSGYFADEATIDVSEKPLTEFLKKILDSMGNQHLHIVAHSMGNRALLRSMQDLIARVARKKGKKFGQIFLAAPDVDTDLFRNLAHAYSDMSIRTTLYISSKDRALASSGFLHDYPRAGFSPPITVVSGIDTVEATNIDLTFLGHGYFADAWPVLNDMYGLMNGDNPPNKRFGLTPQPNASVKENELSYWTIDA